MLQLLRSNWQQVNHMMGRCRRGREDPGEVESLRRQRGQKFINLQKTLSTNCGATSEYSCSTQNCEDYEYSIIHSTSYQNIQRIWRHLCVQETQPKLTFERLWSLGPRALKTRHDSVTWRSGISMIVNTVPCAIYKCRLKHYHAKKNPYVNMNKKLPPPSSLEQNSLKN